MRLLHQLHLLDLTELGLDSCIQAAWCHYHDVLRELIGIPDDDVVVSGLSLGYMDSEAPANQLLTERKPLHQLAHLLETHSTAEQE